MELLNDNLLKLVKKLNWEDGRRKIVVFWGEEEVKDCKRIKSSSVTESQ